MKVLLIVGGVLFLLLAFALFIAATVMFFVSRKRAARPDARPAAQPVVQAAAQPAVQHAAAPPSPPPPPPPPAPPAYPPETELDGTVMIDSRRQQIWGALHATSGALTGRVFPIDPNGFYIGRDKTQAQVVIESPSVSKRHVWVGVKDGAVVAIDQKSTNGTYLNSLDTAVGEVRLKPGDTLILSDDVARFSYTS